MNRKNFRSPAEDIFIASLSGHAVLITKEFTSVPDSLWGQAYAKGAISEDMVSSDMSDFIESKKKERDEVEAKERIDMKEKMREAFNAPIGYLDKNNNVVHRKIISLLNTPIKKDLVDSIWAELASETEV